MDRDIRVNQGNVLLVATKFHFPGGSDGKEYVCNVGYLDSIPGSGRSPEEGNGNPFQYSCLENPKDSPGGDSQGGAWWATVYGVAKIQARLSDFHLHTKFQSKILSQMIPTLNTFSRI